MLAFGLYTYFFLEAELLFTARIGERFSENAATVFYGLFCFAVAAGFFVFPLLCRVCRDKRPLVISASGSACAVCALAAGVVQGGPLAALTLLAMLSAGIVGASLLSAMASDIKDKSALGLVLAVPYAAAFVLQFILKPVTPLLGRHGMLFLHAAIAAAVGLSVILSSKTAGRKAREPEWAPEKTAETKRYLIGAVAAGLIIFCLYGMMDGIVMTLHSGQMLNPYGWVRLLCVPGILFAGWVFDLRGGRYFPFACVVAMVAAVIAVFLFDTAETYIAALGSIYFFCSFMTMYSLAVFVCVPDSLRAPAFWAAAGRGLKYLAGGMFALAGSLIFTNISILFLALIYLALLIALFVVFFFQGKLTPAEIADAGPPPDASFEEMTQGYGFTRREAEVLKLLLAGQDTSDIAQTMVVTEKTVQNYVSALLSKTGAKSRLKLIAIFNRQTR